MPRPQKIFALLLPAVLLGLLAGCQKASIDNNEAVRAAVLRHVEARGDLGLADLNVQVVGVKFEGDTSEAEVRFLPKGQPPESGMTMHYQLVRDGDVWKVQPKPNSGHEMPPPANPAAPAGAMPPGHPPVAPASPGAPAAQMPPGHPPVAPAPR